VEFLEIAPKMQRLPFVYNLFVVKYHMLPNRQDSWKPLCNMRSGNSKQQLTDNSEKQRSRDTAGYLWKAACQEVS
jgi:hypothetical protein